MKVCAVVPTYNGIELLSASLGGLAAQTRALDEIIVVDDHSADPIEAFVKEKYSAATYLRLDENTGSAGAYAVGMKYAYDRGYDWLWLIDNDAQPLPDALELLLNADCVGNNKLRILCSAVINSDGTIGRGHRLRFDAQRLCKRDVDMADYGKSRFGIDLASFPGQMISREVITRIGLPRAELFLQWDDFDYCLRLGKEGGEILVIPASKIIHDEGSSSAVQREYYSIRNRLFVYREHFGCTVAFARHAAALFIRRVGRIALSQDQKGKRMRITVLAFRDGLGGRLGKYNYE